MSIRQTIARGLGRRLQPRRAHWTYADRPELAAPATITLASPRFAAGGEIPLRHAGPGRGNNVSPALAWSPAPAGTAQLLLFVEDPDAPLPQPIVHLAALLEPGISELPDGALNAATPAPGVRFVPGTARRLGYAGPRPPRGHGPHHYGFHLYALDRRVPNDVAPARLRDLLPLVSGHVLAAGHLIGVHELP